MAFLASFSVLSFSQIYCPDNVVISCLSDTSPQHTGEATVVSGNYHPSMIKYIDQDETTSCNEGNIFRKFYLDVNYNDIHDENEASCTQTITLEYNNLPLNIQYPSEVEYTCLDDVSLDSPIWQYNPCDLVGYTHEDEIFEFEDGACLKIVRTFTVINWCIYDVNTNEGIYTGIQIIKIVDEQAPEIENCDDQYFDTDANCEAVVTLTNSATDLGDCASGELTWRVSVDLWADGTQDLVYGPNEPSPFRLAPVPNGGVVEVTIPEALGISRHKVVWKVTDGCGNVISCSSEFFVEDNKPPTPYCLGFTSSTLNGEDGGQLVIPVSFFSIDALDNCSSPEAITLSFSENINDTERVIECGDAGLQFFRIYYTDEAGNQDFCEVFMLILDNGSCFGKYAPKGKVTYPNGTPIEGAMAYLMEEETIISSIASSETGDFNFGEQALMEAYEAIVKKEDDDKGIVDIEDFILMRSALLGLEPLDFYQNIAADINRDRQFNFEDLYAFRAVLKGESEITEKDLWSFIPSDYHPSNVSNNLDFDEAIPYTSYGGSFDFYGVRTGDLTHANGDLPTESFEGNDIKLALEWNDDGIRIVAKEAFISDGFQFDFKTEVSEDAALIALEDGFRHLEIEAVRHIAKDESLVKLKPSSVENMTIENLISGAKVYRKNASQPSSIVWSLIDNRTPIALNQQSEKIKVFPLPFHNELNVEAEGIQSLSLYNLAGDYIELDFNIFDSKATALIKDVLPSGLYILKVVTDKGEQMMKIIH